MILSCSVASFSLLAWDILLDQESSGHIRRSSRGRANCIPHLFDLVGHSFPVCVVEACRCQRKKSSKVK